MSKRCPACQSDTFVVEQSNEVKCSKCHKPYHFLPNFSSDEADELWISVQTRLADVRKTLAEKGTTDEKKAMGQRLMYLTSVYQKLNDCTRGEGPKEADKEIRRPRIRMTRARQEKMVRTANQTG